MGSESITELNSSFAAARAERLNTALTGALAAKAAAPPPGAPAAPKAAKGKPAQSAPAASASATSSGTPAPSVASAAASAPAGDGGPSLADVQAALGEPAAVEAAEGAADPDAAQGEPAAEEGEGAAAVAPELAELQELGRKKDLRALEKKLGLEEGSLGVTNGSYAALRRRTEAVEAKEAENAKNEGILVQKFGPVYQLGQHAQKGDLIAYGQLIEQTAQIPIAKFIELWTQNVRQMDPRMVELERENARLRGATPAATETPAPAAAGDPKQAAAIQKADTYISEEAKDHPALKLKDGAKDVRAKWLGSFDKSTKQFKLSPKAAADAVLAERRAAHEEEQWLLSGKTPPTRTPRTRTLPRAGASEAQVRKPNMSRQEIIDMHANLIRQAKRAGK